MDVVYKKCFLRKKRIRAKAIELYGTKLWLRMTDRKKLSVEWYKDRIMSLVNKFKQRKVITVKKRKPKVTNLNKVK